MEVKGIVTIGLEHIHPHPDNPRKDLGDLTELSESIKKNGIMQNLTVIPKEGEPGEYILKECHFCPIPVEVKCRYGFRENGCKKCLLKHTNLLDKPRED